MMTDLDIDFYSVVAKTWAPDEAEGWTEYAVRVEAGNLLVPFHYDLPEPTSWLEDWKARGRPVDLDN